MGAPHHAPAAQPGAAAATPSAAAAGTSQPAAALAKAAFRRLALAQLEPTPDNYARAYAEEAGLLPPSSKSAAALATDAAPTEAQKAESRAQASAWAALVERVARNIERGGKQWTTARRKDSLKRVFDGSRSDPQRMQQRLLSLMSAWETDGVVADDATPADAGPAVAEPASAAAHAAAPSTPGASVEGDAITLSPGPAVPREPHAATAAIAEPAAAVPATWPPLLDALQGTVRAGLPADEPRPAQLADRLAELAAAVARDGASASLVAEIEAVCMQARRLFAYRHHLVDALAALCQELGAGLSELSEDDSWAAGQCRVLQLHLEGGAVEDEAPALDSEADARLSGEAGAPRPSVRGVRAARVVLAETRAQQQRVRGERQSAREALKQLIHSMLMEVGELGEHTGRFQSATARHAQAIEKADSLQSLAGVVHAMLEDARTVQSAVHRSQEKLLADRARGEALESRVRELESELRRLSDEVSTDALTQVSNRRGLMQAFESEVARHARERAGDSDSAVPDGPAMAVGLIDIDNFKRLNDTLGHAAGDVALKTLAASVRERLRPADHLARFGGEEFVVLLPGSDVEEGQAALTRLQRSLTAALFLHDGREVFVTFSAGVTAWRPGENLQVALERADEALYEAKRSGKNRTCIG